MNSIAVIVKHIASNMRSRWTDFLTSDGEKPGRDRDAEFVDPPPTREALLALWEQGWDCLFRALEPLGEEDMERTITIRGEAHSVMQAINRQVAHYSYHCGQIVFLAKHLNSDGWRSLSVPGQPLFREIRYGRVSVGIDSVLGADQAGLRVEFDISRYSSPEIPLCFDRTIQMGPDGTLRIPGASGEFIVDKPIFLQRIDGRLVEIPGGFQRVTDDSIRFRVEKGYDYRQELVIKTTIRFNNQMGSE